MTRAAEKEAESGCQDKVAPDGFLRAIFGAIAFNRLYRADRLGILRHTIPNEFIWTTALDLPRDDGAILLRHFDMKPGVWINMDVPAHDRTITAMRKN